MRFSTNDLLNYFKCKRLLFLNKHGDKSFQEPPNEFLRRLWKFGRGYESRVTEFFNYEKPKYKVGDFEKGMSETIKLMEKGVDTIYQGVLQNDDLIGIPDFLIKTKGKSKFGDYYYYPVDVKSASTSRDRYALQLACYALLIGEVQEFTPLYGGLLLLDLDLKIKYLYSHMQKVLVAINKGQKILSNSDSMPDLFIDSSCPTCQWNSFCIPEAEKRKDLSLIPGINKTIRSKLNDIDIKDYSELSSCTTEDFKNIKELEGEKGETILIQTKCLNENKVYLRSYPKVDTSASAIYFDFESDFIFNEEGTDLSRIDYLVGLLKKTLDTESFHNYLLDDELKVKEGFGKFLEEHKSFIFYHYGHYEETVMKNKWKDLPQVELFNIEKAFRDSIIMPTRSYSLKNIAKSLGFNWQNSEASATQSMCWYSTYLETKDKKYLDLSIEYNKDDCYALQAIKDWMISLKKNKVPLNEFIDINDLLNLK